MRRKFLINTQKRLDLPTVFSRDYVSAKGDSSRTECLARVASRTLKSMPLTLETDLSEETERNCTTLVVTFSHNDCTEAGSHPKEKSSFRLLRHRQRQKHESTSMHWDILECRTSDSTSPASTQHCSAALSMKIGHRISCSAGRLCQSTEKEGRSGAIGLTIQLKGRVRIELRRPAQIARERSGQTRWQIAASVAQIVQHRTGSLHSGRDPLQRQGTGPRDVVGRKQLRWLT